MLEAHIESQIYKKFGFTPTPEQKNVIISLSKYLVSPENELCFILNGYAGTGKTSIIGALVKTLKEADINVVMLAPTGRAAKVMSLYSDAQAKTIHKKIYIKNSAADIFSKFSINYNKSNDTVYIVDEASMITDSDFGEEFGGGNLLRDLFEYVHGGQRNKIIIVGDQAQLPPVGSDFSPALNEESMKKYCTPQLCTLSEVMRQDSQSGILLNATRIRKNIETGIAQRPNIHLTKDVIKVLGSDLIEALEGSYGRHGKDYTTVITRSNKRANTFNQGIRRSIFGYEDEVESGDILMVVKNNYQNVEKEAPFEFIANGDTVIVRRIYRIEEHYGFRFAYMRLMMPDYDQYEIERWVMLDTLHSESPSLTRQQQETLFSAVMADYEEIPTKRKKMKAVMENEYFTALQVKFAYAITCHKSQGGQWGDVYIDTMLFGDEEMTIDWARWLYTAITRAVEKVYFVGWDKSLFENYVEED